MKILIAEDDPVSRCFLEVTLIKWGFNVITTCDGNQAWEAFQRELPTIAVLDWMMPGIDGAEVCRRVRAIETNKPAYLILLTAKSEKQDVVAGLCAGADDYITKPFNRHELHARIKVGIRVAELQTTVVDRVVELELALSRVKQLQGLLPICHGICPDCYDSLVQPQMQRLEARKAEQENLKSRQDA